jgi:MFS family permease
MAIMDNALLFLLYPSIRRFHTWGYLTHVSSSSSFLLSAALIATVLYGVWSNYSYKSALLFAAVSSMAGNIAYAMALHYHSIELVMIGRFLNGFGSARSINRRFIADTFSRAERTAASADFVTAGALGMAAGPAIAVALGKLDDLGFGKGSGDSGSGGLFWNKLTAPGWVMLVLWSIFFVVAYWHFEEPDRSNLYGKKKSSQIEANNNTKNNETQRLLDTNTGEDMEVPQKKSSPLYRNVPVMMTLWIYFVLKLTLECLLSSSATLTSFYFGWGTKKTGAFLAFLGLLMFPANMGVARLSQQYQDRELILGTLMVMLVSVLGILSYSSGGYSVIQYMLFGICIFVSTNVLEGPNMSLLSKTIPKVWAKGTFNSGFLATEAGTAARSVGDVLISAAAAFRGVENLLNATFVPLLGLAAVSIWGTRICFDQMLEADEEDDDEEPDSVNDNRNETSAKSTH